MLDKATERILRRMDRMGFAGAGEALREIESQQAEIERLRNMVYAVPPTENMPGISERTAAQTWKEACEANRDEVARLDNLLRTYRLPDEVVDIKVVIELRAEIERLRSQLAAMERGYKSYRDTAEEEFARLRSLIRARLAGPRVDYGTTHVNVLAWDREWLERAKELVGDE